MATGDVRVEVLRGGRPRFGGNSRRLVHDPRWAARAPGSERGLRFSHQLLGRDIAPPWDRAGWGSDWAWRSAGNAPEELWALWEQNVARSRAALGEVLRSDGLGGVVRRPPPEVEPASVRWVVCHMIEEYARHNGHADLLREFVDGQTGE
jgi:hypothetical protein